MAHAATVGRASALPFDIALAAILVQPRPALERVVELAIEALDRLDGDPDLEDDDPLEDSHDAEHEEPGTG